MSLGISNVEIEKVIEKSGDDLKRNFAGVSNHTNCFICFHSLMKRKKMLSILFE